MNTSKNAIDNLRDSEALSPFVPRGIQIFRRDHEHFDKYVIDETSMGQILLDPKYADKKVCIISITGAAKTGKSYLLNFFLRYLRWLETAEKTTKWLESEDKLEGFIWRNSSENTTSVVTEGIQIWSKPFLLKNAKGEDVAVFLMDTEGAFHIKSKIKDDALTFILSTMLSSIQIFNISQNLGGDDLQHLWQFAEYQKLLFKNSFKKPFQNLLLLIRDWTYPYEYDYGIYDGKLFMENRLSKNRPPECKISQKTITSSFEKLICFLMPNLRLEVFEHIEKNLKVVIEKDFAKSLNEIVKFLFDPKSITVKVIDGKEVTCQELFEKFSAKIKPVLQQDSLPPLKTWYEACVEAENQAAYGTAMQKYIERMTKICGYCSQKKFEKEHKRNSAATIDYFKNAQKIGGKEIAEIFLNKLENEITNHKENFSQKNAEDYQRRQLNFGKILSWIRRNLCQCLCFM